MKIKPEKIVIVSKYEEDAATDVRIVIEKAFKIFYDLKSKQKML